MCHNRLESLENCIKSITGNSKYKHEIIVCGDRIGKFLIDPDHLPDFLFTPRDYYNLPATSEKHREAVEYVKRNEYTILKHYMAHGLPQGVKLLDAKSTYRVPCYDEYGKIIDVGTWIDATCEGIKTATKEWIMIEIDSESYFPKGWDDNLDRVLEMADPETIFVPKILRAAFIKDGMLLRDVGELNTSHVFNMDFTSWYSLMYMPVSTEKAGKYQVVKKEDIDMHVQKIADRNTVDREPCGHRQMASNRCMVFHRSTADRVEEFRKTNPPPPSFCMQLDDFMWNRYNMNKISPRDNFVYISARNTYLV